MTDTLPPVDAVMEAVRHYVTLAALDPGVPKPEAREAVRAEVMRLLADRDAEILQRNAELTTTLRSYFNEHKLVRPSCSCVCCQMAAALLSSDTQEA